MQPSIHTASKSLLVSNQAKPSHKLHQRTILLYREELKLSFLSLPSLKGQEYCYSLTVWSAVEIISVIENIEHKKYVYFDNVFLLTSQRKIWW